MNNDVILIQGAMDIEIEYLIRRLDKKEKNIICGFEFFKGTIDGRNVVISKMEVGVINATIATTLGIINFHPDIVINQGIAGAHRKDIHTGDIIIGKKCCNINAYSMPTRKQGEGSSPFEWELNKRAKDVKYGDTALINIVENYFEKNNKYKIKYITGTLGSGDVFNKEYDRIIWINDNFQNDSEDMESIGTYTVCDKFSVPCLGIRIISNNEILGEKLNKYKAFELQMILINLIKEL